jgi:MFS family permease
MKEGYLHDYLAASFIGLAFGLAVHSPAGTALLGAIGGNWGPYIATMLVVGVFGFIPGGFVAGYVNFRFHQVGEKIEMVGLSAGFFTAFVYTIISLFGTIVAAIFATAAAGTFFIGWIIGVLLAFVFFSFGGYISGYLERRPFAMPTIFDLSRVSQAPPPPPSAGVQMCPTCGKPMSFMPQYNRWYCNSCKKYS